ncbi:MAG: hypothetical protein Q8Q81_17205 [Oxalobacteraceae bacterium]|nr:hypothetical protein [Oxalobacteraceae bacterium]
MTIFRWTGFLPLAVLASILAGAPGYYLAEFFGMFEWQRWSISGASSAFVLIWVGLKIAPKTTKFVKWSLILIVVILGSLSAVGALLRPDELSTAFAGIAMVVVALSFIRTPIDELRDIIQPPQPPEDPNKKEDAAVQTSLISYASSLSRAVDVVTDYSVILERVTSFPSWSCKYSTDELFPHDKQEIDKSIHLLLGALADPHLRAILESALPAEMAETVLSQQYHESLKVGLICLDNFSLSKEEADEDRQLGQAMRRELPKDPKELKALLERTISASKKFGGRGSDTSQGN